MRGVDQTDNSTATASKRQYLAAIAASVSLGGCLQFSEADTTANKPRPTSDRPETTTESGPTPDQFEATDDPETPNETKTSSRDRTTEDSTTQSQPTETPALPPGTRWIANAQAPFIAGPVVVDETVIATSLDRHVYAFDIETGAEQWSVSSETKLNKGLSVLDGVAVATGFEEQLGVAVDDGTVTYRKQAGVESGIRAQVIADDAVYQCGVQGGVRALDPDTGEYQWTAPSDKPRVAIDHDGDTICVGLHPTGKHGSPPWAFAGFDAATGDRLWYVERDSDASSVNPQIAVADGTCLAYNSSNHHMRINARTGDIHTEVTDSQIGRLYGTANGTIVVTRGSELQGISNSTENVIWATTVGSGRYNATCFDDGTFWYLSNQTLYKTDISTGDATTVGDLSLGGTSVDGTGVEDGLAVAGETVFVTTSDAHIRALEQP
ncbi:PQQ-binding-like beta-propeller repeat protein [Halosimplex pelagicum]|uniref:PQQ-binding-like beta-propeller repeat protein n=1 Tax=Halosimplex pelagicum TaxID=869886 RepID=A0A7D5TAE8_9EURY|nr:PQQ-binding-like beta-propeller repeat protein [Halosimplex pelagicum]QLH81373.1 PQQ-binding-like beta-propeller repeat protein [Halosimplex pelagicum]